MSSKIPRESHKPDNRDEFVQILSIFWNTLHLSWPASCDWGLYMSPWETKPRMGVWKYMRTMIMRLCTFFEQKLADHDPALSPHQSTHEVVRCRKITILKTQHSQKRRQVKGRCSWRGKQIVSCSRPDSIIARQVGVEHHFFFRQESLLGAPLYF